MRTTTALILVLAMVAAMASRIAWEWWPSLTTAVVFWVAMLSTAVAWHQYLLLPGMLCNALVTLVNGGFMPVYGETASGGVHIQGTSEHLLQFLCDRFVGGTSIGDFLLLAGLIVSFLLKYFEKRSRTVRASPAPRFNRPTIRA